MNIYLTQNGQQLGPFTLTQLQDMVKGGSATLNDFAWYEGLSTWVSLGQVPGMNDPALAAAAAGPQKRPVLVWIICLLFFTCMPFALLSMAVTPMVMQSSGMVDKLPEAQRQYFKSQGFLNYYLPTTVNVVLSLAWAIQLFRLKRNSLYLFLGVLGMSILMLFVNIFTMNWLAVVHGFAWLGVGFAWVLDGLLLYYNWYLIKTKVLR